MEETIFEKIRQVSIKFVERSRERLLKLKQSQIDKETRKREYEDNLIQYAGECKKFFSNTNYQNTQKFLDSCEKNLTENLINMSISVKNKDELLLDITRIGAQLKLLKLLKSKPYKILKQYDKFDKKGDA